MHKIDLFIVCELTAEHAILTNETLTIFSDFGHLDWRLKSKTENEIKERKKIIYFPHAMLWTLLNMSRQYCNCNFLKNPKGLLAIGCVK